MNMAYLISFFLCLFLLGLLVFLVVNQGKKTKKIQRQGLTMIAAVRDLISSLQTHRGRSAAYTRGDKSVIVDINNLKQHIAQLSRELEKNYRISRYDRWLGYEEHWQRLSEKTLTLSSDNSFKQHTQLIGSMLYLLEDIAEAHHLTVESLKAFPTISLLWRELLQVAEYIGQSRALGTGVATVKLCTRVEKIKLGFLRQKITEVAENSYDYLASHHANTNHSDIKPLLDHASKQTRYLCAVIEHELVEASDIKLDANNYFQLATEAMNSVNAIFDFELKRIEQHFVK